MVPAEPHPEAQPVDILHLNTLRQMVSTGSSMKQLQHTKTWASRVLLTSLLFFKLTTGLPLRAADDTAIKGMSSVATGEAAPTSTPDGKSWRKLEEDMQRYIGRLRADKTLRDQLMTEGVDPVSIAKKNGFEIDSNQIVVQAILNATAAEMDTLEPDNDLILHFSMNPRLKPGSRLFFAQYYSKDAKLLETHVYYYQVTKMSEQPCCSWNWTLGLVGKKSFKQ
jgi:hypothetical protein